MFQVDFFLVDIERTVEDLKGVDVAEGKVLIAPGLEGMKRMKAGRDCLSHSWRHGGAVAAFAWG